MRRVISAGAPPSLRVGDGLESQGRRAGRFRPPPLEGTGHPLEDHVQYWNRWDDGNVVVRDISDLARRYAPLQAVRWASPDARRAHLGITMAHTCGTGFQPVNEVSRGKTIHHTMIRTGRIDNVDVHDGLPPEPMTIFMKWLAREAREQTAWARRHLADRVVTWQFDTADGLKYAANYDSAEPIAHLTPKMVRLRMRGPAADTKPAAEEADEVLTLSEDEGLYGDGSLAFQKALTHYLRRVIERG